MAHVITAEECINCGACESACPVSAISQDGDKFFASIHVQITEEEYRRTHPEASREKHWAVGIDLGLKEAMTLSDGIAVSRTDPNKKILFIKMF